MQTSATVTALGCAAEIRSIRALLAHACAATELAAEGGAPAQVPCQVPDLVARYSQLAAGAGVPLPAGDEDRDAYLEIVREVCGRAVAGLDPVHRLDWSVACTLLRRVASAE